ncbi:hypothetical protein ACFQE5_13390 [Pseudonocardia hispaniensis]|uniref:GGDEF domain-containing protein n=1 Tax=Pseudonocardia hispaniensis TaxID=904933 RepID=A0ABW1J454_9PSEU
MTVLRAATALRWTRPDLTAALGEHVMRRAEAEGDDSSWAVGAGWLLHGRSAIGDARQEAVALLESIDRGPDGESGERLAEPAATRLRVELAAVALDCGESAVAHTVLGPIADDPGAAADIRFDALVYRTRAALSGPSDQLDGLLRSVEDAAEGLPDTPASAVAALLHTAADRERGRHHAAAERAEAMLVDLGWSPARGPAQAGGDHLAAAFATQWIGALLDAGRAAEARRVAVSIEPRLAAPTFASRQIAQLRLMWVSVTTGVDRSAATVAALSRAAQEAADAGAPTLEAACRTALAEVHEAAGQLDAALASMRLGVVAERRDQERTARFRAMAGRLAETGRRAQRPRPGILSAATTASKPTPHPRPTTEPGAPAPTPAEQTPVGQTTTEAASLPASVAHTDPGVGDDEAQLLWNASASDPRTDDASGFATELSDSPLGDALFSEWRHRGTLSAVRWPAAEADTPQDHLAAETSSAWADSATSPSATDAATAAPGPGPVVDVDTEPTTDAAQAASDWLTGAIAEIDRVWGVPDAAGTEPAADPPAPEPVVVLDLVADGTRVTGRAARAAMRRVGRRLGGELPPGARMRDEGPDAVGVILPAASHEGAESWLRSVLGDLVDGLPAADELNGVQLRATMAGSAHSPDVEIMQRLGSAHPSEQTEGSAIGRTTEETRPPAGRRGAVGDDDLRAPSTARSRTSARGRRWAEAEPAAAPCAPVAAPSRGTRHATDGRPAFRPGDPEFASGSVGRRRRRTSAETMTRPPAATAPTSPDSDRPRTDPRVAAADVESSHDGPSAGAATDRTGASARGAETPTGVAAPDPDPDLSNLGLADLLAGALAAYRGM